MPATMQAVRQASRRARQLRREKYNIRSDLFFFVFFAGGLAMLVFGIYWLTGRKFISGACGSVSNVTSDFECLGPLGTVQRYVPQINDGKIHLPGNESMRCRVVVHEDHHTDDRQKCEAIAQSYVDDVSRGVKRTCYIVGNDILTPYAGGSIPMCYEEVNSQFDMLVRLAVVFLSLGSVSCCCCGLLLIAALKEDLGRYRENRRLAAAAQRC
jgi:hypothetical protein